MYGLSKKDPPTLQILLHLNFLKARLNTEKEEISDFEGIKEIQWDSWWQSLQRPVQNVLKRENV